MPLAKQILQFVFGATDQDTSKKGVKAGDLIEARNVQQIKGGELSKREGFTATAQNYGGASIAGDSLTSPDGLQVITRDATTDAAYARSTDATHNKSMGASLRYLVSTAVRFQAATTGQQVSPMAKQAGDYSVWLPTESEISIARRSSNGKTEIARLTLGVFPAFSKVKSFAVVDSASFDSGALWIYWIDWSTNSTQQNRDAVWAARVPHDLSSASYYTVWPGTQTNRINAAISAACTETGIVTLAICGVHAANGGPDDYANFIAYRLDVPHAATSVTPFRRVIRVDPTGTDVTGYDISASRSGTFGRAWTCSGICMLTAKDMAQYHSGHVYFAFWSSKASSLDTAQLVLFDYNVSTHGITETVIDEVTYAATGVEATHFVGTVTGHETSTGATLAGCVRACYRSSGTGPFTNPDSTYPDRIFTKIYLYNTSTGPVSVATLRGAWIAHGYFTSPSNVDMFVTGWQDAGGIQMPYHLRRLDTGAILAQFSYGEGTFSGGCANVDTQINDHVCDLNQPGIQAVGDTSTEILLPTLSANVAGSADVSTATIEKPTYQDPASFRRFALSPGPIPTIVNGTQTLQEAGPLVYPSHLATSWQIGEHTPLFDPSRPITNGDTGAAVVYRLTDSSGAIWRSSPYTLANALRWDGMSGSSLDVQILRIPTLRHLLPVTIAQIEIYFGQVDLQLFRVIPNDPTVDFIDVIPQAPFGWTIGDGPFDIISLGQAVANAQEINGVGEDIYTTGGALPNDPPPQLRGLSSWRNRVIGWFGNQIWPSQEFATGIGIQWSSYMRMQWDEGTGDILGGCMIDWNYFAVFKADAIGIIDGPGPDSMGHGNYIVRTLTTKAGCSNPKSLINGADGCYYQDSQTKRLMLLTPDLQTKEAMPGAFDAFAAGLPITAALHVEQKRQVWFFIAGTALVLDYKHRTQTAPLGEVYTWPLNQFTGNVSGAAIVAGSPLLLDTTGETSAQVSSQYYDLKSDGTTKTAVNQVVETGELQPFGTQGLGDIRRVQLLGEFVAQHSLKVTTYPQFGSGDNITASITAAPEQVTIRPVNCQRVQSMRLRIEELTNSPGTPPVPIYGSGFKFFGFAMEVQSRGRLQDLDVGRNF